MTGREAADYILINHYDDAPLVIWIGGNEVNVRDICLEPGSEHLVIMLDFPEEKNCRKEA